MRKSKKWKVPSKAEMKRVNAEIERDIIEHQGLWYADLKPSDWLFDGYPIRGDDALKTWHALDWSNAYVDLGPSIAGNLGPYWHVPLPSEGTVHRLYPKLLRTKWARIFRQAALEMESKAA